MNFLKQFTFFIGILAVSILVVGSGFWGCAGEGEVLENQAEEGDIVISLTDAEGDFSHYSVDVLSLTLTRANGAIVNTLPLSTRIDFSQYTEMTEFLTSSTIPNGRYTRATMTLDYQNADIWVENAAGEDVKVTDIRDQNGDVISTLTVTVHLSASRPLVVAPGIPAHLTLDFDLSTSNRVTFDDPSAPELIVEPILLAAVNPERPKIHRVRGALKSINIEKSSFRVIIRPFLHAIKHGNERFGTLRVTTSDDTVYDINERIYIGHDGLTALDGLPVHSAVIAFGDLKFHPYRFVAREVHAGSSVPGGTLDVVTGNVISRTGDTLILKGASLIRENGSVIFNDKVTIHLGEETVVTRQLSTETYGGDDISIGQRITVFGVLTNDNANQLELDATAGYIRMLLTLIRGTVVNNALSLIIDLQSIDNRRVGVFSFQGTGVDEENDADPENYEIDTNTLDISDFEKMTPINMKGFAAPFGQAPPDFSAVTVIDVSGTKASMHVSWRPATADPFEEISTSGVMLNLLEAGPFHHLAQGKVVIDLTALSSPPVIQPDGEGETSFLIRMNESVQFHPTFDSFISDLQERLESGYTVMDIFASGFFNQETAALTAGYIIIKMSSASAL